MFKKVLLISLAVIVLIAAGLTVYVSNMDWNTYKNDIAARFSNTLGKKIEFSGNLNVSLWPKPHLSVKNVNILNPTTSEKIASVKNLEAQLSLRALLEGTPEIESLSLNGTEIWYVVDENGVSNWRQQQKGVFLDSNIEFNRQTISIQNSWVHYQNRKHEINFEFSQVNADIVAESLVGPYRIDGNFVYAEDNFGFAVGLGDISQTDEIFLNFAVTHPRSNSYILYDGNYNMISGAFKGNFSGEFQLLAKLVNSLSQKETLAEMFNVPFVFSVVLEANSQQIILNSLALKYANAIEGSGNVIIPLVSQKDQKPVINIDYQLLNLDARPLMMVAQMALQALQEGQAVYEPDLGFDVAMNISVQRMVISEAAEGALENVSFKGLWQNNELNIDEFYAACPGNIVWTMTGSLLAENKLPSLFLKMRFEGKNIGAFARAFNYPLTAPSQSAYRNVDISFNLLANPQSLIFNDLKIAMDKSQAEGLFKADFGSSRAKYELTAEIDSVNFDNYIGELENVNGLSQFIKQYINSLVFLQDADWSAQIAIEQTVFKGVPLQGLTLDLITDAETINIKKLTIKDVLETKIALNTVLKDLRTQEPSFAPLNYTISSAGIAPFISKIGLAVPQWQIFNDQPLQAVGSLTGNLQKADIDTSVTLKDMMFSYKGALSQGEYFEFDGYGNLKSTNFSKVVNDLGGHWEKFKNTSALNCSGVLKGNAQNWSLNNTQCILGTAKYEGDLSLRHDRNLWLINGKVNTTEFDLANVLDVQNAKTSNEANILYADDFMARPAFGRNLYSFDLYRQIVADIELYAASALFGGNTLQNLAVHIKNEGNKLNLDNLKFDYQQAQYDGYMQIDYTQQPKISGKLDGKNIKLEHIGGKIYRFTSGLAQAKIDFVSDAVSADEFMKNLNGSADFDIVDLGFDGIDLGAIEQDLQKRVRSKGVFQTVRDNLQRGHTDFQNCQGKILFENGVWHFQKTICTNERETLEMEGLDDVGDWQMNNQLTAKFASLPHLPPIGFSFSGLISKPTLDINVEAAVKQYDDYWAKIEQQEQAKQDEQKRQLNTQMDLAQKDVNAIAERLSSISAQLEDLMAASNEDTYVAWYKQKHEYLQTLSQQIDEMQALARQTDFTVEDIAKIKQRCVDYNKDLDMLEAELKTQRYNDLKAQLQTLQDKVRDFKQDNSRFYSEYQTQKQEKFSQIIRYDASQNPSDDKLLQQWQQKIEKNRDDFWDVSYKIGDKFAGAYNISNSDDLHKELEILNTEAAKLSDLNAQMKAVCNDVLGALDEQIQAYKTAYEEEQKRQQALEQQEREANKDNLLANSEEKAKEPKQAENAENSNSKAEEEKASVPTLRAIDDSVILGNASGKITPAYSKDAQVEPQQKPALGILRAVDGDVEAVSGSIRVK